MLTLYHTLGCHLCEQAEILLLEAKLVENTDFKKVDIGDSEALVEAYGVHIPVLVNQANQGLYWPFDVQLLTQFIGATN